MLRGARALAAAIVATGACILVVGVADASAASLFLCVPTTAGQAAVSGGSSASNCGAGTTAVDTAILSHASYTDTGIDGKPTITFTGVNVQVVSGAGSTSGALNGEGNVIIGYAEDTSGHAQTGSNDLIVGSENGWKSYGEIVGGYKNQANGKYATALGDDKQRGRRVQPGRRRGQQGLRQRVGGDRRRAQPGLGRLVGRQRRRVQPRLGPVLLDQRRLRRSRRQRQRPDRRVRKHRIRIDLGRRPQQGAGALSPPSAPASKIRRTATRRRSREGITTPPAAPVSATSPRWRVAAATWPTATRARSRGASTT